MRRSITKEEEQNSTGSMEDTNRQQDLDSAAQFFASESTRTSTMNQEKPNAGSELRGSPTANDDGDASDEKQQQQQQQEPPSAEPVVAPSTRSSQATNSATRFFETMQSEKQQQQQSNSSSNLRNRRKNSNSNLENSNVNATTTSNKNNNNSNYRDSVLTGDYTEYNDADDDHDRLLACCSHPSSCYEAMVCMPCFIQRQLTALDQSSSSSSSSTSNNKNDNNDNDNDEEGSGSENAPWIFYCVSWFFVVPALRHEVNSRFGKQDGCCFDFFAGVFCPHLSLAQTHRQLCYLGSAPKGWFLEPYHNQRMV